jgi:3-oxoadipate CoA-transferase beta subunit
MAAESTATEHTGRGPLSMDELAAVIGRDIPAVGGAMDLAIGAKDVYVMMTLFTKKGEAKLVPECTYPLTGVACVSRVYTDYAVFAIQPGGVRVLATYGISLAGLRQRVNVKLAG